MQTTQHESPPSSTRTSRRTVCRSTTTRSSSTPRSPASSHRGWGGATRPWPWSATWCGRAVQPPGAPRLRRPAAPGERAGPGALAGRRAGVDHGRGDAGPGALRVAHPPGPQRAGAEEHHRAHRGHRGGGGLPDAGWQPGRRPAARAAVGERQPVSQRLHLLFLRSLLRPSIHRRETARFVASARRTTTWFPWRATPRGTRRSARGPPPSSSSRTVRSSGRSRRAGIRCPANAKSRRGSWTTWPCWRPRARCCPPPSNSTPSSSASRSAPSRRWGTSPASTSPSRTDGRKRRGAGEASCFAGAGGASAGARGVGVAAAMREAAGGFGEAAWRRGGIPAVLRLGAAGDAAPARAGARGTVDGGSCVDGSAAAGHGGRGAASCGG
jgi:hypothetical protein